MASAGAASDHPLSPLETPIAKPSRRKLSINAKSDVAGPSTPMMPPVTSYFALKLQSEERERVQPPSFVVDRTSASSPTSGKVRLPSKAGQRLLSPFKDVMGTDTRDSSRATSPVRARTELGSGIRRPSLSLSTPALASPGVQHYQTPSRRAISPRHTTASLLTSKPIENPRSHNRTSAAEPRATSRVLATQWHTLSNSDAESELQLSKVDHYDALRILSAALEEAHDRFRQADDEINRNAQAQAELQASLSQVLTEIDPPLPFGVLRRILEVTDGFSKSPPPTANTLIPNSEGSQADDLTLSRSLQQAMADVFSPLRKDITNAAPDHLSESLRSLQDVQEEPPVHDTRSLSPTESAVASFSRETTLRSSAASSKSAKSMTSQNHERGTWTGWWAPKTRRRTHSMVSTDNGSIFSETDTKGSQDEPPELLIHSAYDAFSVSAAFRKIPNGRGVLSALGLGPSSVVPPIVPKSTPDEDTPLNPPQDRSENEHDAIETPETSRNPLPISRSSRAPSFVSSTSRSVLHTPSARGPPSHLRAIFNSTRIMTAEPGSILVGNGATAGALVSKLAMDLVTQAREEGLNLDLSRSPVPSNKERLPSSGEPLEDIDNGATLKGIVISSTGGQSAATTLGQALVRQSSKKRKVVPRPPSLAAPLLGAFSRTVRSATSGRAQLVEPPLTSGSQGSIQPLLVPVTPKRPGTVEMESIIPALAKPPTLFLSRSSLASPAFRPSFPRSTASRFSVHGAKGSSTVAQPLTDRYGFIYDVSSYYVKMLQSAKEASSTAPASLTGVKIQEIEPDDEGWPQEREPTDTGQGGEPAGNPTSDDRDAGGIPHTQLSPNDKLERNLQINSAKEISETSPDATAESNIRLTQPRTPSKPMTSLTIESHTPQANEAPRNTALSSASTTTISLLLSQLTEIHDKQQISQKAAWDIFLKRRRSKASRSAVTPAVQSFSQSSRAAILLGLDHSNHDEEVSHDGGLIGVAQMGLSANKDEWRDFSRLVRGGVPLVYRPKFWLECSGAQDITEPGLYQELLSQHRDQMNLAVPEIEKDVTRTMPLNIFFGGDGVGVDKLRRVLQAYSWRNPDVGYCQGMNLIASTLLLVLADEEQAFWVLTSIVEKLLPSEFFSPSLLVSRACPMVLLDYVQELMPNLYLHLLDQAVDLPAICFSWFLSLFTDCLPVETLFRVWDVFFVDGMDTLFRIAIALLKLNELELLQCESMPALYLHFEGMTGRMWQADKLLKLELELKATVLHEDLIQRREQHISELKSLS